MRKNKAVTDSNGEETTIPTAVCFRFRNKGDVVDTIEAHQQKIRNNEFVWWGWWSKENENAPKLIINKEIEANAIKIYLINANEGKFYTAKGETFATISGGQALDCPGQAFAPDYYKDMSLKMWIKLTEINLMTESEVDSFFSMYSFCYVGEHLEDKDVGVYDIEFNNRRANCLEVFSMQPVSIWFLRDCRPADRPISRTYISLWKESRQRLANFSKYAYKTKTNKIMILSDLHFGKKHAFVGKNGEYSNLAEAIIKTKCDGSYSQTESGEKEPYSGLIISGDFTWEAKPEEFNMAYEFIDTLSSKYDLKPQQIAIVPGNHDIRFRDDREEGASADIKTASIPARKGYRDFYKRVYHDLTPESTAFCVGRRIATKYGFPIEIICLDSNILEQREGSFVGQGFVGQKQIDIIKREMELLSDHFSYRILVLHHSILQATFQEDIAPKKSYSVLLDCGRVLKFIKDYKINLVVHGHNHADLVTGITLKGNSNDENDYDHFFHVIAIGSTGVEDRDNALGELIFDSYGNVQYIRKRILLMEKNDSGVQNGSVLGEYNLGNVFQR